MPDIPLSEHCSLMSRNGEAKPAERPADCPKDAAYIKTVSGGRLEIPGNAPFPVVFEGGDGNDHVVVVGKGSHGVQVYGGRGDDTMTVESEWIWLADRIGPTGLVVIAVSAAVFLSLAIIVWRGLSASRSRVPR